MQTRKGSLIEISTTTTIGYCVSVIIGQLWLYPAFGMDIDITANAGLTASFVAVSVVIKFLLRRIFTRNQWFKETGT